MSEKRRVVVTGIGLLCPIGGDDDSTRERLFAGQGAIAKLRSLDAAMFRAQNGAELDAEVLPTALAARKWRPGDRTTDMALVVSAQALEGAGLLPAGPGSPGEDTSVVFGTGNGPSHALQDSWETFCSKGGRALRPSTVPRCMMNVISSQVSITFGLKGCNYVIVSSCSSSTTSVGIGFRNIAHGYADRVLCGGSDSMFTPALFASWDNLGVMSRQTDPARASRPFDLDRDGFVMGEGAGALLLESLDSAKARGARIRAEVLGFGESSDGTHITRPSVDGQALSMQKALRSAGLQPGDVDFINAHGSGTKANDITESEAIGRVFVAGMAGPPVLASKSFYGHLLGAAGIVEAITTIFCLEQGRLHPNLGLERPDPACDVRLVGTSALTMPLRIGLKNSFGFGGGNATLILGRYEE